MKDPFRFFKKWYQDAEQAKVKNPEAMTLSTSTLQGRPSARIVLYKGMNTQGLCFYTHYRSRKGRELLTNPRAALVFYWSALDRQIRIEGKVSPLPEEESDRYWQSRPRESRLGALASHQSAEIPSRRYLELKIQKLTQKYRGQDIPRPAHWGGFCLIPQRFEFWQSGDFRVHDRFCYQRIGQKWKQVRLSP